MIEKTPYRLLLVSLGWRTVPTRPEEIYNSNDMIVYGLWTEFRKLPHVEAVHRRVESPMSDETFDFTLFHCYFGEPLFSRIPEFRKRTRHHVLNCIELPLSADMVDHNFLFLPPTMWPGYPAEHLPLPCPCELLAAHNAPKTPGSILLDHRCTQNPAFDWTDRIHEWLQGRPSVSQLRREAWEGGASCPDWIRPIPESNYPDYLDATAECETFILTHRGSYEHSILDMLQRGSRVLVPLAGDIPFTPQPMIESLGLPTFSTREELLSLLADPPACPPPPVTDMPQAAAQIDAYCQKVLNDARSA